MQLDQILTVFNKQAAVCAAIGITKAQFTYWKNTGRVPARPQLALFFLSGGELIPSDSVLETYKITPELLNDMRPIVAKHCGIGTTENPRKARKAA